MKPLTTTDLSSGIQFAAARAKAALRATIRKRLLANPQTKALPAEQIESIADDAADVCIQHTVNAVPVTINVNVTGK
jgi:hypothetical protein